MRERQIAHVCYGDKQRPYLRNYILRVAELIEASNSGTKLVLNTPALKPSSLRKRTDLVRRGHLVLFLQDYPQTDDPDFLWDALRAKEAMRDVDVLACGLQIPFLRWMLLNKSGDWERQEDAESLPALVAGAFGLPDAWPLETAEDIKPLIDQVDLVNMRKAALEYARLTSAAPKDPECVSWDEVIHFLLDRCGLPGLPGYP